MFFQNKHFHFTRTSSVVGNFPGSKTHLCLISDLQNEQLLSYGEQPLYINIMILDEKCLSLCLSTYISVQYKISHNGSS